MLKPLAFTPYRTGQLTPTGWLRRQLEIQAAGLAGNLDKVWPDIRDSKWIGGDREGWERVPYWLDGFIPLAWQLDDDDMKARATRFIDAILERQREDGWLCPCEDDERERYDVWALFLICKVLVLYHDCTRGEDGPGDERIPKAVYRALRCLDIHVERNTIFNWAATRWYECLIPLFWLYERQPEDWMLDLAHKLCEQGTDYEGTFENWRYGQPHGRDRWSFMTHVVNMAMMLKSRGLYSRLSGEEPGAFAEKALDILLRDHGMAVGHFTGDECLSGLSPVQGSECCSVAEAMYSYEWLAALTGDSAWCDRLERAAYNALPATISPDMWTHQYVQMTNQVQCTRLPEGTQPFRTNSGEAHLFGLEPHFGCCTANFGQGWPKLALSTLMAAEDGIVVTAIAPCRLRTRVKGVGVTVEVETCYPFADSYTVHVKTDAPVEFTLHARVPADAVDGVVDGKAAACGFVPVARVWDGEYAVEVRFGFRPEIRRRPGGRVCVWRGPLLYAVPIEAEWRRLEYERDGVERKFPYCDYELLPKTRWNYALAGEELVFKRNGVGRIPFDPAAPPVSLTATMVEVDWPMEGGVCAENPASLAPKSGAEEIVLIPYGCTCLRMTEVPQVEL